MVLFHEMINTYTLDRFLNILEYAMRLVVI